MRHHFCPPKSLRDEVLLGTRLKAAEDAHRRELATVERTMLKRVESAERLCGLAMFELGCVKKQVQKLVAEVGGMRRELEACRLVAEVEKEAPRGGQEWVEIGL